MPQMQGNALEISLDFQFGPIPAIFSAHAPALTDNLSYVQSFTLADTYNIRFAHTSKSGRQQMLHQHITNFPTK